jgi:hypothetical protein
VLPMNIGKPYADVITGARGELLAILCIEKVFLNRGGEGGGLCVPGTSSVDPIEATEG